MGCTVGLGPTGRNQEVEGGKKRTVGWGALWWLAREGPGLGVLSCSAEPCLGFPRLNSLSCEAVSVSYSPHMHRLTCTSKGP